MLAQMDPDQRSSGATEPRKCVPDQSPRGVGGTCPLFFLAFKYPMRKGRKGESRSRRRLRGGYRFEQPSLALFIPRSLSPPLTDERARQTERRYRCSCHFYRHSAGYSAIGPIFKLPPHPFFYSRPPNVRTNDPHKTISSALARVVYYSHALASNDVGHDEIAITVINRFFCCNSICDYRIPIDPQFDQLPFRWS